MTKKKIQIWLPLLLAAVLAVGMLLGYQLKDSMGQYAPSLFAKKKTTALQEILELIRTRYVDTVRMDSLSAHVVKEIFNQLDPHSSYIPAKDVQDLNNDLKGNFEGIGVEFDIYDDTVTVLNLLPNGPADVAGIRPGDQLLQANKKPVSGVGATPDQIRKEFTGPRGTAVTIRVRRNGTEMDVVVQRGVIPIRTVDAAYMLEPGIGYVRLSKFSSNTYEEFMERLEKLRDSGMQQLILDLRDNGGGVLDDAIQIADEFLDGAKEIVSTEGRAVPRQVFTARRPGLFETGKLVVLINENTASASEVLTGALQDWDRATIIGRRSFGKGLVQEQYFLSDGSAIRLTVSRYVTPVGRNIQKPYEKGNTNGYDAEVLNRIKSRELFIADSMHHNGKQYRTKNGRLVYGGGGITPDIFVPADSTLLLIQKNNTLRRLLSKVAFRYVSALKDTLQHLKAPEALHAYLQQDPKLSQLFYATIQKDSSITLPVGTAAQPMLHYVQLMVARQLWRKEGFYKMNNLSDPMIQKAREVLRK
ncbi:MAG: S41 family peptidase [Lacibacter sp.]|jgi:carboxyl-terminal processing protease